MMSANSDRPTCAQTHQVSYSHESVENLPLVEVWVRGVKKLLRQLECGCLLWHGRPYKQLGDLTVEKQIETDIKDANTRCATIIGCRKAQVRMRSRAMR
ncbi:hypothetical protein COY91_00060 [Candidatus Shapirobacteria bacterium CG_4_10_14_0_8_um_filter_39_15]|nr:MAG: hypothetical protein COY91_00060 [Candidatus Shapirobacteria bacterium CG_4_10_14_0_8_um_filter_39_15]